MAINKRLIRTNDEGGGASFNTVLWTGNEVSGRQITGVGFQPDFVWIKDRGDGTHWHNLFDSVRGASERLFSNTTNAESFYNESLQSFDSDGFTVGLDPDVNRNGGGIVAWCWKAGGAAVSVPNGIGTSSITQSANVAAGFSITNYTGSVTGANKTIPHGLSTAPSMVIIKDRDWGVPNWFIWHQGLSGGDYYLTFTTAGEAQNSTVFSAAPTNSVVNLGIDSGVGDRTDKYIAYCFAEVAGFSKFGSYVGNGSTNGPTITTGFEPAFVMIKRTDTTGDWFIFDNKRNPTNNRNKFLQPNKSNAEGTGSATDYVSFNVDNFKLTSDPPSLNGSGGTYIYMAFANQF